VASLLLLLWCVFSSSGTGNPYGVVGVCLHLRRVEVGYAGVGFTQCPQSSMAVYGSLRVTFSVSSVFEDGKRRLRLVFHGGVSLVFSYHPSTGEGLLVSSLVV
ncbi:unnamed protein product, partial [Brassica oleracea]